MSNGVRALRKVYTFWDWTEWAKKERDAAMPGDKDLQLSMMDQANRDWGISAWFRGLLLANPDYAIEHLDHATAFLVLSYLISDSEGRTRAAK